MPLNAPMPLHTNSEPIRHFSQKPNRKKAAEKAPLFATVFDCEYIRHYVAFGQHSQKRMILTDLPPNLKVTLYRRHSVVDVTIYLII